MNELDGTHIASIIVAVASLLTALGVILNKFKRDPGQKEKDEVTTAEASLDIAKGTVEMVSTALKAELARINKQLETERQQRLQEQAELRALHAEQLSLERKQTEDLKRQIREVNDEMDVLRASLREAQSEATKWKREYEAEVAKNGTKT